MSKESYEFIGKVPEKELAGLRYQCSVCLKSINWKERSYCDLYYICLQCVKEYQEENGCLPTN